MILSTQLALKFTLPQYHSTDEAGGELVGLSYQRREVANDAHAPAKHIAAHRVFNPVKRSQLRVGRNTYIGYRKLALGGLRFGVWISPDGHMLISL